MDTGKSQEHPAERALCRLRRMSAMLISAAVLVCGRCAWAADSPAGQAEETKTFFFQFVVAGGPIVWFVLLPISIATVHLAAVMLFTLRRKRLVPAGIADKIVSTVMKTSCGEAGEIISRWGDLVSTAAAKILKKEMPIAEAEAAAAEAMERQVQKLGRSIDLCGIIGNVAPMVGLFGTVYGMIKAFNLLGISAGQPRPDQLASAISVALITTFWGLLTAIPALVMQGLFRMRLESYVHEAAIEVENVLVRLNEGFIGEQPKVQKESRRRIQTVAPKEPQRYAGSGTERY